MAASLLWNVVLRKVFPSNFRVFARFVSDADHYEAYDPAHKYKSEFQETHSLAKVAERRKMLGLDPVPPDTFQPITEVEESTTEWHFVERLLPMETIPTPPKHDTYPTPSGWQPPADPPPDLPYYVHRNRSHVHAVYYEYQKVRLVEYTTLKGVEGDIWALAEELRSHLEKTHGHVVPTQVNEVVCLVRFRGGNYKNDVIQWLMNKGF